jgi:hypothetical protein
MQLVQTFKHFGIANIAIVFALGVGLLISLLLMVTKN